MWKTCRNVKNYGYTTQNLLVYLYHQQYYKLVGIEWSRQKNMSTNYVGKLQEDSGVTMVFITEKQLKSIPNFS